MSIKQIFNELDNINDFNRNYIAYGWVRTCRTSSSILGFCNLNDGSNPEGLQIVISDNTMKQEEIDRFFKDVKIGAFIDCIGKMIKSPAEGQKYEMQLEHFELTGKVDDSYPLSKTKMNLDTLRNYIHLRARTNHDFYHERDFLHLDPNVITVNECEGGAGVFQLTEKDITNTQDLQVVKDTQKYDWSTDHFCRPAYLTVSSQLQLEAMACALGNVYTMNKSFRSEHSSTSKHVSEFTHLEIEMVNNTFNDLMYIGEIMIKYVINRLLNEKTSDMENLNKFVSKGLINKLTKLKNSKFIKIKYKDAINEINEDISKNKKLKLTKLNDGDDLGSDHENYITQKYETGVFITYWPIAIKSFYMKQCDDKLCESFDLLIPYGIGELIGASQRENNYDKLVNMMDKKGINKNDMSFYLDLRKFGSCPHGGFGLGFDRLLMLVTGMQNIKDVIPFPVYYKSCKF